LIESLYRTAAIKPTPEVDEATVIGTIENFELMSSSPIPVCAVHEELTSDTRGENSVDVRSLNQPIPFYALFNFSRMTIRAGAVGLLAIGVVLASRQVRIRPVSVEASNAAVALPGEITSVVLKGASQSRGQSPANTETRQLPTTQTASAARIAAAPVRPASTSENVAPRLPKRSPVSNRREAVDQTLMAKVVVDHRRTYPASPELPRIEISGPPQKLVYPVCPETSARGKVSLKAVIGYDGRVSRVRVLNGNRALAAAAVEAIRQWRYQPASKEGQSLEREANITVSFIADDVVALSFPNFAPPVAQ
jgi:TonB family protein